MTNIQQVILYGQLEIMDEIKRKNTRFSNNTDQFFDKNEKISFQEIDQNTVHSEWMFGMRFNEFNSEQKQLELYLFQHGIDTRPMFYEMNKHKYLSHIENEDYVT